jgi:hypothetical protein
LQNVRQYKFGQEEDTVVQPEIKAQKGYIQYPDCGWVTPVEIKALKTGSSGSRAVAPAR